MAKQKPQASPASEVAAGQDPAAVASVAEVPSSGSVATVTTLGGESIGGPDGVIDQAATESAATGAADPAAVEEPGQQQAHDEAPPAQALPAARVRALVLSDNAFGRCGEVREFEAAHAAAIEAGGFIDTHPNAVASAEGD